ncbi:oligosaccharide flippase family protein [Nonomuraea sp. NPDC050643]|uniref:oligosaccharide flippase family protein n=1 Tax=Nonomuraea sp. NPDC050643 TaxID=3155660 RepID=UPI0034057841
MDRVRDAEQQVGSLGKLAGRGLGWGLLGNLVTKAGSFVLSLILARTLLPADFGVYAVALAATAFVMSVKDLGIMAATMQWRGRLEEMAPTATVLSFVSATALYGVFWVTAPAFAELSGTPQATPVIRLLTAIILVEGFTAVRSAALIRRFEQDRLTLAIGAGFLVNAVLAVVLAVNGAGPYSFAVGQLAQSVVTGVIVFVAARLPVRLGLDRGVAARLLRFGVPSAAGIGLETILLNAGYIVVGAILKDETWIGYYLLAFNMSSWVPGLIGQAVRNVTIPGFSRLAEHTPEALSEGVRRATPLLLGAILPIAVVMSILAHPLVLFVYGEPWNQAAGVLRWLAVMMVIRMLLGLALDILTGQGDTRATAWMNLAYGIVLVPALIVGTHLQGIRGTAIGQVVAALFVALPVAAYFLHRAGVRLAPVLPGLVRPLLAAGVAAAVTAFVDRLVAEHPLLELLLAGSAGLIVYVALAVPPARLRRLGHLRRKEVG